MKYFDYESLAREAKIPGDLIFDTLIEETQLQKQSRNGNGDKPIQYIPGLAV
jgi:hypothetical protein